MSTLATYFFEMVSDSHNSNSWSAQRLTFIFRKHLFLVRIWTASSSFTVSNICRSSLLVLNIYSTIVTFSVSTQSWCKPLTLKNPAECTVKLGCYKSGHFSVRSPCLRSICMPHCDPFSQPVANSSSTVHHQSPTRLLSSVL